MNHSSRTTEGVLLLLASLVLLLGLSLVFVAKLPALRSEESVNINTASADEIAAALRIERGLADVILRHREEHGHFANTAALRNVRLLTSDQAVALAELHSRQDLTALTPGRISARSGIGNAAAVRLVEVLAARGDRVEVTASSLSRIRVIDATRVSRLDSYLRVRDAGAAAVSFCLHVALLIIGFFVYHAILRGRGSNADPFILPCVFMLAGLGVMALFSMKDPLRDTTIFASQMQGVLIGVLAAIIPLTTKFRSVPFWRYTYVYALLSALLILILAIAGEGPGGAKLRLLGFQPVEVIKLLFVFFAASYLADRWGLLMDKTGPNRLLGLPHLRDIGPLVAMYLASLSLFLLVKDMGPMLVLFGTFAALIYIATGRPAVVGMSAGVMAVTGWLAHKFGLGVFDVRVDMWLSPWKNAHPNGMQLGEGLWGLATGGIWGSGPGLGSAASIPGVASDLIFISIGEELGLVGSVGMLVLLSLIIFRGFHIALHARSDFDKLLAAGITALFGIQTVVIVFGVLGLTPLTGITLPFVSYGKSSLIVSLFTAGLLLGISSNGSRMSPDVRPETRRAVRGMATGLVVLLLGVAGIGRLCWIQGVRADHIAGRTIFTPDADGYVREHVNPRLRSIEAGIPRGSIYDRNGRILATSKQSELDELGLSDDALNRPRGRCYPYGASVSHLVGYLDSRCGGPVGLEKSRNNDLRGFDNYSALLPVYRLNHTPFRPEIEGKDVRLTIDAELQVAVENALRKHAGAVRDRRTGERKHKGAAVVLDIRTGEVLAAVSIPGFDPNELTPGAWRVYNEDKAGEAVLFDRARFGAYTPGSVFKLVTGAAALENGIDLVHNCTHQEHGVTWRHDGKTYSRRRITDLEEMQSHGRTDLGKAIRVSCNLFFARLGIEMGPEKLYGMTSKLGLSRIAPPKRLAEDLPDNAYGQGTIQVSPLDMARVVAVIANDGVMMRPQFVREISVGGEQSDVIAPVEAGRPMSPETAAVLRRAMADAAANGTGRGLFTDLGVSVGGKTGSAENDQADRMPHSWFVGFAPVEDPRIAFAVVVENGGYGRSAAGPVCREIVKSAL